jgi:hypothetical protein
VWFKWQARSHDVLGGVWVLGCWGFDQLPVAAAATALPGACLFIHLFLLTKEEQKQQTSAQPAHAEISHGHPERQRPAKRMRRENLKKSREAKAREEDAEREAKARAKNAEIRTKYLAHLAVSDWRQSKRDHPPPAAQAHFPEKAPRGAGAPPGGTPSQSPAPRAPPAGALGGREEDKKPGEAGDDRSGRWLQGALPVSGMPWGAPGGIAG